MFCRKKQYPPFGSRMPRVTRISRGRRLRRLPRLWPTQRWWRWQGQRGRHWSKNRPLGNLHGNWFSLHKLIPNVRFIHRVFQLYAIFNQSDIGPLIGRVELVAARLVSSTCCLCVCVCVFFLLPPPLLFPCCFMSTEATYDLLGTWGFVSAEPCPRRFTPFLTMSRLSVSLPDDQGSALRCCVNTGRYSWALISYPSAPPAQ